MHQTIPLLTLPHDWQTAINQAIQQLNRAGLQVMRSFDLHTARVAHTDCTCPHHGTAQCDCQMVVLLVYDQENPPVSLVAHGRDQETHFALVETPQQSPQTELQRTIRNALKPDTFIRLNQAPWGNVT